MEFKTYKSPGDFSDFSFPDVSLPPLSDFTYDPSLWTEKGGKKVPRELTPEEKIQISIQQSLPKYDLSRPLYNYSKKDSEMYNDEDIVYNPYLDMNEIYSKTDPFTWGESFLKAAQNFRINSFSTWKSFVEGLKGATRGDLTAIYDNPHIEHLADLTENLEKINPQYKTQDEIDNPLALRNMGSTIKSIIPAFGIVGAGLLDIAVGHIGATIIGAAAGAVVGEGVGAIPGAVAGNILQLGRDLNILKNTVSAVYALSKGVNTAKTLGLGAATLQGLKAINTANNIRTASQLVGTTLFYANAEAALQAELNARNLENNLQTQYYDNTGKYATGEELKRIEDQVNKTRNWTYGLNLALLSASNAYQFGNLLRGKVTPRVLNELPINYVVKDGVVRAAGGSVGKHILKDILKNSAAEGLEEWGQSLIDDVVGGYFDDTYNNRADFLDQLGESLYKNISTQQAWTEFLGGALIGGITSAGPGIYGASAVKKRTKEFVDNYNSTTSQLFDAQSRSANLTKKIEQAMKDGDPIRLKSSLGEEMFNLASSSYHRGAAEANMDLFRSMETMDNQQFNSYYGLNLNEQQQVQYAKELQEEFAKGVNAVKAVYGAFKKNPFQKENWFIEEADKLQDKYKKEFKDRAWTIMKEMYAKHLYLHDIKANRLEDIKRQLPIDDYLLDSNSEAVVRQWKKRTKEELDAGITRYLALYTNLSDNPVEAHDQILNYYDLTPAQIPLIREGFALNVHLGLHADFITKMQETAGQKEILKEIFEFLDSKEQVVEETTQGTQTPQETPAITETPVNPEENVTRETEVVKEEDLTRLDAIAKKIQEGKRLTAEERQIYDNNLFLINEKVDEIEQQIMSTPQTMEQKLTDLRNRQKLYPTAKYFEYKGKVGTFIQKIGDKLYLVNGNSKSEISEPSLIGETDKTPIPQAVEEGTAKQAREERKQQTNLEKFVEQTNLKESDKKFLEDLTTKNLIEIIC